VPRLEIADGAALLLAGAHTIGEIGSYRDVVELRGGLVYQELQVAPPLTVTSGALIADEKVIFGSLGLIQRF